MDGKKALITTPYYGDSLVFSVLTAKVLIVQMTKGIYYYYFCLQKQQGGFFHFHTEKYSENTPYRNDLHGVQPYTDQLFKNCPHNWQNPDHLYDGTE